MRSVKIGDDILDTRDVDARIEELEELENELDDAREEYTDAVEYETSLTQAEIDEAHTRYLKAVEDFSAEEAFELKDLLQFKSELEGYCDWNHGEALIEEDYRQAYAEQLAEDIGAINREAAWPLRHIDWEAAANELFAHDYTYAELGGFTYYVRMC